VNETTTDVDGSNSSLPDADAWLRTAERAGRVAVGLSRFASPSPKNTAASPGGGGGGSSSKASESKSRSTTPATPLERRAFSRSASKGLRVTIDEDDEEK
jgi:uncharacterized membrane protein